MLQAWFPLLFTLLEVLMCLDTVVVHEARISTGASQCGTALYIINRAGLSMCIDARLMQKVHNGTQYLDTFSG